MRLTVSRDPRRRALLVHVDRALDYPSDHVSELLAATVADLIAQVGPAPESRLRRGVLRALDRGATVAQAARRFGVDAALIDRWDDDAAVDARTDLLADPTPSTPRAS